LEVAAILATQATHLSNSSKATNTIISVSTSTRGSFLSNSSSIPSEHSAERKSVPT
jgi:archaellum component FlaG (FlaF/FlaG flagellin family)